MDAVTHNCPCGLGETPCPGPDGLPLCMLPPKLAPARAGTVLDHKPTEAATCLHRRPHGLDELEGVARHLKPNSLVLMPARDCLDLIDYIRNLEAERDPGLDGI